jgi:tryptophan 2,3-dioxygenase
MSKPYPPVHYHQYLQLDNIIGSQKLRSEELGKAAHDEMLFIIIHQTYELWFKQVLHELDSVLAIFAAPHMDEKNMLTVVARLNRINEIFKIMDAQFTILETMTPLDFLEFREYLYPASGFQSFQFRMVETKLGLKSESRLKYNNSHFSAHLLPDQKQTIDKLATAPSLFEVLEKWLERTPFLEMKGFDFWQQYQAAVRAMLDNDKFEIDRIAVMTTEDKKKAHASIEETRKAFDALIDPKKYEELRALGHWRLSYKALHAALLIQLYRDQPILHLPFQLITSLIDMDKIMTSWRSRHALLALRMLGNKIGTGGSSGYNYLKAVADQHKIFQDFYNLTTFFIPRSALPPLPKELEKKLGFSYQN